jgi:hypothetical protein
MRDSSHHTIRPVASNRGFLFRQDGPPVLEVDDLRLVKLEADQGDQQCAGKSKAGLEENEVSLGETPTRRQGRIQSQRLQE